MMNSSVTGNWKTDSVSRLLIILFTSVSVDKLFMFKSILIFRFTLWSLCGVRTSVLFIALTITCKCGQLEKIISHWSNRSTAKCAQGGWWPSCCFATLFCLFGFTIWFVFFSKFGRFNRREFLFYRLFFLIFCFMFQLFERYVSIKWHQWICALWHSWVVALADDVHFFYRNNLLFAFGFWLFCKCMHDNSL